jgi:protein SCO1/2
MQKILLYFSILVVVLTAVTLWSTRESSMSPPPTAGAESGGGTAAIGGEFVLVDRHAKPVKDADFRGRLMLVFFGFTHCPDICPITAKSLSDTLGLLGDKADQLAPIFISVDPQRDTPEVLTEYFSNFDPRIIALTGSADQIKQAAGAYKAYYAKAEPEEEMAEDPTRPPVAEPDMDIPPEQAMPAAGSAEVKAEDAPQAHAPMQHGGDYMVDHSGYIYLMDREGKYVKHFPYDTTPEALAQALTPYLK